MTVTNTVNLGTPISVSFDISDGIDGRSVTTPETNPGTHGSGKFLSTTGNDWIGLFPKGQCVSGSNNQDKHKCYVAWEYVSAAQGSGVITFQAEQYKYSGEYEARYFYGDDPTDTTTADPPSWVGQGWVCNVYYDSNNDAYLDALDANLGSEGNYPAVSGLSLAQCRCDTRQATQAIQVCSDSLIAEQADCTGNFYGYGRSWDAGQTSKQCDDSQFLIGSCAGGSTLTQCQQECEDSKLTGGNCMFIVWDGTTGSKYSTCNLADAVGKTVYSVSADVTRTWLPRVWSSRTVTAETCVKYRAACGRCMLDAVAYSNTVLVTGSSGTDTYQDMSSIPGFEIGF